ncbi:hypothetical protein [Streptomyces boncukensis]|uniref:Uncharacterized protein n=1 Tax=Streptomyces boncukensis TaxID=2711219 RepID=A0A6G4X2X6_9ACTN|nr:hypothetical protein [Streptomyces boncukensis]NGO71094.1 hypothetical protein [Streptomyces boncukensis]
MSKHTHTPRTHQPQRVRAPGVRREHGGMPTRPDDEELARRAEAERVAAGLADYDPADVPPATEPPARRGR